MKTVVVPGVKLSKGRVQTVTFEHDKKKHVFVAKTQGCPPINVRFEDTDKKFHAFLEGGVLDVPGKTARDAFVKAAERVWYA